MANEKGKAVKITERVTIKALNGNKYMKEGKNYKVHPELAARLVNKKQAEIVKTAKSE